MDFKSPFTLQCVLVIITMIDGHINKETIPVTGIIGGSVDFPLGIENLKDLTDVIWVKKLCVKAMPDNTSSTDCDIYCNKMMCLRSGSLQLTNVSKEDEGEYEFTLTNTTKKYFLLKVSGDLLGHPLFLYILAACGGGAIVLAVLVSLITCCYQKSKQKFIPVPSEEEKEERMTMSVISSEETKSPPNGDRHEASSAPAASPPKPENTETCQGLEAEHEMEAESEVTPDPEVVVDINNQEFLCDSFPDPIDP
ncbi:uncharacterized protein [Emydura macquarii macquarii]|uniref:uncharacterized protein n=1 Tax=Emydura macquarii macquarii TaxID=1129001 RepID=UPI00352B4815